jgi:glycogen debranching enzyme
VIVGDIIQIKDQFYILATSSLADDRTLVLKSGETFAVLNRVGDIESIGLGEQGLYHRGTRHLSRLVLRMGEKVPQILRSTIQNDNAFLTLDMMNTDLYTGTGLLPRGSVHLFRSKFLWRDTAYDRLRLANFFSGAIETTITLDFAADYSDIFQVRGTRRKATGELLPAVIEDDLVVLSYRGLDNLVRSTRMKFDPRPTQISEHSVSFNIALTPKQESTISIAVSCEQDHSQRTIVDFGQAMSEALDSAAQMSREFCHITTSDFRFNAWLSRSEADLHMLIAGNPEGAYPYAGVPWFNTVFGRDGIITAMECLWAAPWIAKSVLKYLAETQATEVVPEQDAEPGKILHEMRHGEMANLKEVPFGRYYGSVDATPLFVMLAGAYFDSTSDLLFLREIWPNILAALDWIDTYGDADGDGFVEYQAKAKKGLVQQGWKDSHDSIFHSDGTLAEAPIALCEVQAYVFGAKKAAARIASALQKPDLARKLEREALAIQYEFETQFWDDELGTYALALDGQKRPCRVRTSNAGHCLWAGITMPERAARVVETLFSEELFCGWGIRTLGSGEARYNPMAYHNGSVWPHDNALIASGMSRYGYKTDALRILHAMFEASSFMDLNRLPELFCGFHKRSEYEGPTLYPVACSPQAWAAGSVYMLFESCLGIELSPSANRITFNSPQLPHGIDCLDLTNLRVGRSSVDIRLLRDSNGVSVNVLRNEEGCEVCVQA